MPLAMLHCPAPSFSISVVVKNWAEDMITYLSVYCATIFIPPTTRQGLENIAIGSGKPLTLGDWRYPWIASPSGAGV